MKSKLKKPTDLAGMNTSAYTTKLKSDLEALTMSAKTEEPVLFVLHSEYEFDDEKSVLFVAGLSNAWKKHIKSEGWLKSSEAKKTWLGVCKREGDTIQLTVKKGKLTNPLFQKAIKQNSALKKLEWVVTEAIVSDDDDDLLAEGVEEEPAAQSSAPEASKDTSEALAEKLLKQIVVLIPQVQKDKNPADVNQLKSLSKALYAIPNWKDFTPDNLEKTIAALAGAGATTQTSTGDSENAARYTQEILMLWAELKTTKSQQQVLKKIQTVAQNFQQIPNWQSYADDRIEKALANAAEMLAKINTVIAPYEEKLKACATIEQMEAQLKLMEQGNPSGVLKTYIEEVKEDIQRVTALNEYINQCLDAQEAAQKQLEKATDEAEKMELTGFIEAISEEIQALLA